SGFDSARAPDRHADSDRSSVSPAARHLDRSLRRTDHHAYPAGGLRRPLMDLVLCNRALAIPAARPRTGAGWRLILGRHALCGALLSQGEARVRHGILRRRHDWRRAEHVRRPDSGQPLWLAIGAESLRRRAPCHRGAVLAPLRPRSRRWDRRRLVDGAATPSAARSPRLEILPILFSRIWRLHRVVGLDAALFQQRIRFLDRPGVAARRLLLAAGRRVPRGWRLAVGPPWRAQRHLVGAVGGLDRLVPALLPEDRSDRAHNQR